jgi:O-antigen/teichoic acid export membrane protein
MKILFLYIVISCPGNLIEYIYLLKDKSIHILVYGAITFGLQVICVITPIVLGYSLEYGLYGLVFVSFIRFIWLIVLVYKYSEFKFSENFLKEFIKVSTPLTLSILISGGGIYVDSILVGLKFDKETLAIFRYGAKELPFVSLIPAALGNALTPSFSEPSNLQTALVSLKKETKKVMHFIFPVTLIVLLLSKYLYPIIFNKSFTESYIIFNIYILLIATRFIFARTILIGKRKMKILFDSSLVELSTNVVLSIIFINLWGIVGVAIATLLANIVEKFYLIIYLKMKENIKLAQYIDLKIYSLYFIALVVVFSLNFII